MYIYIYSKPQLRRGRGNCSTCAAARAHRRVCGAILRSTGSPTVHSSWKIRQMIYPWQGCHCPRPFFFWICLCGSRKLTNHECGGIVCLNGACAVCEWVMSHLWMSHVILMNESCHTYEWESFKIYGNVAHSTTLQHTATHVATHCNASSSFSTMIKGRTEQHTAAQCSTL